MEIINGWIFLTIMSAFLNAVWTSMTAKKDENLSSSQFTILFRFLTVVFLIPIFIFVLKTEHLNGWFFFFAFVYAIIEGLRTIFIVKGSQEDYYATYAFVNMSPIFTLLFTPLILAGRSSEKINMIIIIGTFCTIIGGFLFYRIGKFSKWGLIVAFIGGLGVIVAKLGVEKTNGITFSVISFFMLTIVFSISDYMKSKRIIIFETAKYLKSVAAPAFVSSIATLTYFMALESGPVTKVANLLRTNLIFGFILSYFVLKEIKDWRMKALGAGLILLGGVIVSFA